MWKCRVPIFLVVFMHLLFTRKFVQTNTDIKRVWFYCIFEYSTCTFYVSDKTDRFWPENDIFDFEKIFEVD